MQTDHVDAAAQRETGAVTSLTIEWVAPHLLVPHPRQATIYGEEDVTDLVEAVRVSEWLKPLVITPHNVIISGHRRLKTALFLQWRAVPVERRTFASTLEEITALLLENRYREKTPEQRAREGAEWEEIESLQARLKFSTATQNNLHHYTRRCKSTAQFSGGRSDVRGTYRPAGP